MLCNVFSILLLLCIHPSTYCDQQEAATHSWKAMIDEDRLLQRLETLEAQLTTYAKVKQHLCSYFSTFHSSKYNPLNHFLHSLFKGLNLLL